MLCLNPSSYSYNYNIQRLQLIRKKTPPLGCITSTKEFSFVDSYLCLKKLLKPFGYRCFFLITTVLLTVKIVIRRTFFAVLAVIFLQNCQRETPPPCTPKQAADSSIVTLSNSLSAQMNWPEDLNITAFSGPEVTPSPAVLTVKSTGEVFVGVDMQGSLGKDHGKGSIQRLVDCNQDGTMDTHSEFTKVNNTRE